MYVYDNVHTEVNADVELYNTFIQRFPHETAKQEKF